jgi:hypothetical protein
LYSYIGEHFTLPETTNPWTFGLAEILGGIILYKDRDESTIAGEHSARNSTSGLTLSTKLTTLEMSLFRLMFQKTIFH